jgi:hyaluronan synthase
MREIDKIQGLLVILSAILVHVGVIYMVFEINERNLAATVFWAALYSVNFLGMFVAVFHRPPNPSPGKHRRERIIAIVPAFNEEQEAINATIESLLDQSVEIAEIHVVDDCSDTPMEPYRHDRVFCHWHTKNKGKREAQATALRSIDPSTVDFILTIDSDSILDHHATEHLLQTLRNEKVTAVSGTVLLKNLDANLLTRAQELQYGQAFLVGRNARRAFGVLETTSGACAMYRAATLYFHLDDYLAHGNIRQFGDDRRLCLYALMEGNVLHVPEAVVYTDAPESLKKLWKQNVRWAKSTWSSFPYSMANLGIRKNLFVCHTYFSLIILPLVVVVTVLFVSLGLLHIPLSILLYHIIDAYTRTFLFALAREASFVERWLSWLLITPLMVALIYLIIMPARYYALFKLKDLTWGTRTKNNNSKAQR